MFDNNPVIGIVQGVGPGGSTLIKFLGGEPAGATGKPPKLHAIEGGREPVEPLDEARAMSRRVRMELCES